MQNPFKKHPLWSTLGAILCFLLITVPLYLGKIWPILEWAHIVTPLPKDQTLPQWILEQRWPGMTSVTFNWVMLGSVIGMFILFIAILRAVHQNRREVDWLEAIADEDSQHMAERLWHTISRIKTPMALRLSEPYVDLRINLLNTTVYTVTFAEVEGHLTYYGHPLQRQPEAVHNNYVLAHTRYRPLVLRQYLQPDTAKQIIAEGKVEFGIESFAVWFTYEDRHGLTQRVRKSVPVENLTAEVEPPAFPSKLRKSHK